MFKSKSEVFSLSEFEGKAWSEPLGGVWAKWVTPLLERLDAKMDRRLVDTLSQMVRAILSHRHRACGLLLSELGAHLLSPSQAPAGTKRLGNLLRCAKWSEQDVAEHLWPGAQEQRQVWHAAGEEARVLWDGSVLETPQSQHAQGLSPVRSSRAARLWRIKPGYYRPPGAPVFVPGWNRAGTGWRCC